MNHSSELDHGIHSCCENQKEKAPGISRSFCGHIFWVLLSKSTLRHFGQRVICFSVSSGIPAVVTPQGHPNLMLADLVPNVPPPLVSMSFTPSFRGLIVSFMVMSGLRVMRNRTCTSSKAERSYERLCRRHVHRTGTVPLFLGLQRPLFP